MENLSNGNIVSENSKEVNSNKLLSYNHKLIMGARETFDVHMVNVSCKAKGGKRKTIDTRYTTKKRYPDLNISDEADKIVIIADGRRFYEERDTSKPEYIAGQYHHKNYKNRKAVRAKTLVELVNNNFAINKTTMITLTFDAKQMPASRRLAEKTGYHSLSDISDLVLGNPLSDIPYTNDQLTHEEYQDIKVCHGEFKKFVQKIKYRFDGFKYVAVFDRQKKTGNWHYHVISNLFIDKAELRAIWGVGGVDIKAITSEFVFQVKLKYLLKNMYAASNELKGEKGYLYSKGLQRYIVLRSGNDAEWEVLKEYTNKLNLAIKNGARVSKHEKSYTIPKSAVKNRQQSFEESVYEYINSQDGIYTERAEPQKIICTIRTYTVKVNLLEVFHMLERAVRKSKKP